MTIGSIPSIMPTQASMNALDLHGVGSVSYPLKPGYGAEDVSSAAGSGAISGSSNEFAPGSATGESSASLKSFGQMLTDAVASVNKAQEHASDLTTRFAAGEPLDVHQVMIASQEANVALNLALQVRNKLTDAYTEIMHVNV